MNRENRVMVLPRHDCIGEYALFAEEITQADVPVLRNILANEDRKVTEVIFSSNEEINFGKSQAHIQKVNFEDLESKLNKTFIPNWVSKPQNIGKILQGNYMDMMPITAEFVTTLNCNYRCVQCAYKEPKKSHDVWMKNQKKFSTDMNSTKHMTSEVMAITLDRLAEGNVKNILFTGGGEPLMNRETVNGMARAKANGQTVALYSNGRLMDIDTISRLIDIDPLFIRISVYGGNPHSSLSYTQAAKDVKSFDIVLKNISNLAKEKLNSGSKMNLGLSYIMHPITANYVEDFAKTIAAIDYVEQINYIRFTPAVDYFHGQQHDKGHMLNAFSQVEKIVRPILESKGVDVIPSYHRLEDLYSKKKYNTCRASGWYVEVAPSGELFLCCEKHFIPEYKIGDLTKDDLQTIWLSDERKSVIQRVNDNKCENCPTLCKPHELNKIFHTIERKREKGDMPRVKQWVNDLIQHGRTCGYCPKKLDDFQS